ncbi:hypothetical protein DQ353_00270 [Arthrobacter sp. AQ5-05]|uniref:hypothetical protein n=1 Tax=Arthrobacter sp. AQ5-05 TaxID=2184581 RepID=UPI000DCEB1A1|nr:hypothetical protein [Arthrobacter sp. AQ5-05]RAX50872.1 hypothetical protein DQ353_00270 [Arthrobacter sp. AQ5-05]
MDANTRFWSVVHVSRDLYALQHDGGSAAHDIDVTLSGHAVINGRRDWSHSLSEMNPGDRLQFKLVRAMGVAQDPPVIHVEWRTVVDGTAYFSRADMPVPR